MVFACSSSATMTLLSFLLLVTDIIVCVVRVQSALVFKTANRFGAVTDRWEEPNQVHPTQQVATFTERDGEALVEAWLAIDAQLDALLGVRRVLGIRGQKVADCRVLGQKVVL